MLVYQDDVASAIALIVGTCVFYEGSCEHCEFKELCNANKPIDMLK